MSTEEPDVERWSDAPLNGAQRATEPTGVERTTESTSVGRVHGTPAPQYGEYAPEGWQNPILAEQERLEREEQMRAAALAAQQPGAGQRSGPGVAPAESSRRFGSSVADLIFTVLLLVVGVDTVIRQLNVRSAARALADQFAVQYTSLSDPSALITPTAITAGVGIALLIGAFIWSFFRARHRKTTFWVPLLAGVVWTAVSVVLYMIVIMQDSALMTSIMNSTR